MPQCRFRVATLRSYRDPSGSSGAVALELSFFRSRLYDLSSPEDLGINNTWEIHGCNRLRGQGGDGRLRGTDGSNPPPSSRESATNLTGKIEPALARNRRFEFSSLQRRVSVLVEVGKVHYDSETSRYTAAEPGAGPDPELVQDRSNIPEVQKVSPKIPL